MIELEFTVAVCGEPDPWTTETEKLADELPWFSTVTAPLLWKSRVNSATPKLRLGAPSNARAMTCVRVAGKGCTSPLPPFRAE